MGEIWTTEEVAQFRFICAQRPANLRGLELCTSHDLLTQWIARLRAKLSEAYIDAATDAVLTPILVSGGHG